MNYFIYNKGYTLLFAIIVSSIVLSIAAFVSSVSRKQFILSSTTRDSTIAIYAADSAIQCAVSAYFNDQLSTSTGANISCNRIETATTHAIMGFSDPRISGMGFRNDGPSSMYEVAQTSAVIQFSFLNDSCAQVVVSQGFDAVTLKHKTIIDSRGYVDKDSQPCNTSGFWNPRGVERAIRLVYND